ncbi:MAG: CHAT domain-containing protein [Alphaproteobacteria bacterium]|nr:CHAT domain-containing protein [Alphaproteobacteria bacterium]
MHELIHLIRGGDAPDEGIPTGPTPYRRLERGSVVAEASFDWSGGLLRDLPSRLSRAPEPTLAELGRGLHDFLEALDWEARGRLFEDLARGEEALLTVRVDAEELLHLPLETAWSSPRGEPIHEHDAALVRYELAGLPEATERPAPAQPGVLFVWGGGVPPETAQGHREALAAACEAGGLVFRELDHADLSTLRDALDAGGFSALHLLAHGRPGDAERPPAVELGPDEVLTPRGLRRLLRDREELRLMTLMVCHGGAGGGASLRLGGLAQAAQLAGVPAVIASRWLLAQSASVRFTRALYEPLAAKGTSLERALRAARGALLDGGEDESAFSMQLLARSEALVVGEGGARERRELVATYPFGVSAQPRPGLRPRLVRAELVLDMDLDALSAAEEEALLQRLLARARDREVAVEARLAGSVRLFLQISEDGLQRLFLDHRAGALSEHLGVTVLRLQAWPGPIPGPPRSSEPEGPEPTPEPPPPTGRRVLPWVLGGLLLVGGGLGAWWWFGKEDPQPPKPPPEACVEERCDGQDNDCDGRVDEDAVDRRPFFADNDGDGVGGEAFAACGPEPGLVEGGGDCDDADAAKHPGAPEACDQVDNDCDGRVDEDVVDRPWYADRDQDGFGGASEKISCAQPRGYVAEGGDCDDADAARHPGAEEVCDGVDDDCDGQADEGVRARTWFQDRDQDGYGSAKSQEACAQPRLYVAEGGDCDDGDASRHPGATELQDQVDQDCDGAIDEGTTSTLGTHFTPSTSVPSLTSRRTLKDCTGDVQAEAFTDPRTRRRVEPDAGDQKRCMVDVRNAMAGREVSTDTLVSQKNRLYWTTPGGVDVDAKGCSCAL